MDSSDTSLTVITENLLTGKDGKLHKNMAIIVEKGKIISIKEAGTLGNDNNSICLKNGTLLPGFIDSHVHAEEWQMPYFLACGVTTIRDVGNRLETVFALRDKALAAEYPGPKLLCCGPLVDGMPYCHDKICWGIESEDDMLQAVRTLHHIGISMVKFYSNLDSKKACVGIKEAKSLGMHTLGHFENTETIYAAMDAGIDELEHLAGFPLDYTDDILDKVSEKSIWLVPTQVVFEESYNRYINVENFSHYISGVPDNIKEYWLSCKRDDQNVVKKGKSYYESHRKYIKSAIAKGLKLSIGTDAPCGWVMPGHSYLNELKVFKECGMENDEIIRCSTWENAKMLGISNNYGSIEIGKYADMIFVEGDPLKDILALGKVKKVFKEGFLHDPRQILHLAANQKPVSHSLVNFGKQFSSFENWKETSFYREYMLGADKAR